MRLRDWLLKSRWRAIAAYLGVVGIATYIISTPLAWWIADEIGLGNGDWGLGSFIIVAVVLALHAVFLWPVARPGAGAGKSLMASAAVAGLLIGVLALGLAAAVMQIVQGETGLSVSTVWWVSLSVLGAGWAVATPLVWRFVKRGRRETVLARLAARLFMGTMLEAAALIPLDVMVRRKEDCMCGTGTFLALVGCGTAGIFVLGPVVFLPLLAKRRKRWYASRCDVCGYDMSSTPRVDRCPECGAGWRV